VYVLTSYALASLNIDRFSKLIHCQNQENICNNTEVPTSYHTSSVIAIVPWWNVNVLKATIENKTTSVITHFKTLTTGNNVFIDSIIIQGKCRILQFLHKMFNVSALLLGAHS